MYSIVLMMAMTNGSAAPEWQDADGLKPGYSTTALSHREYRGRRGCNGGGGCWGGGGWGGCHGGGWGGCHGGGGWGGCHGGGGCWGGGYAGCSGGGGGCYGGRMAYYGGGGRGCYAVSPYCMTPTYAAGSYIVPSGFSAPAGATYGYSSGYFGQVSPAGQAPAMMVVALPAEAKLTIDDTPTTLTAASRSFITPPLEPGREFQYTLKAEIMR